MSRRRPFFPLVALFFLSLAACGPKVYTQAVPVSTNPLGASVYADGREVCKTPCSVTLPRNADHILTIVKDGYAQEDVVLTRSYEPRALVLKAARAIGGIGPTTDPRQVVDEGAKELADMEESGEAYHFVPGIVRLDLAPAH